VRTRKRLMLLTLSLVACAVGLTLIAMPTGIVIYGRIKLGMTASEVEAVIGEAPGFHDSGGPMPTSMSPTGSCVRESGIPLSKVLDEKYLEVKLATWYWDDYWLWVAYDASDRVVGCYLFKVTSNPWRRSFGERVRLWVGL